MSRTELAATTERELERFLDGWRVENDVPGASVAVPGCRCRRRTVAQSGGPS